jgi:hypothetical protein
LHLQRLYDGVNLLMRGGPVVHEASDLASIYHNTSSVVLASGTCIEYLLVTAQEHVSNCKAR